jgi:flagellar biosynthetic protein FliR
MPHPDQIILLALVLARVAPLVMLAPIFGSRSVPLHVRGLLAVALSIMVAPLQWDAGVGMVGDTPTLWLALATEILTGISLGLAVLVVFHGAELAGRLIGGSSGLVFSDGAGSDLLGPAPVPAQLLYLVALAVFVTIGGHRLVVAALLDSFQSLPPGTGLMPAQLTDTTTQLLAASFQLGVRAAAPVIVALLVANLAIGILSRSMPQLNSFVVGFGFNLFVVLAALCFALAAMAYLFGNHVERFLQIWQQPM